jgi:hypothetical protein
VATTAPVSDAAALGRRARKQVSRSSHRDWAPAPDRPAARAVLAAQDRTRVSDLVPIRYGRMLVSPFTFYRGAAAIMAGDLGSTPNSGLEAQLCGDAHLSNFGIFEAPDRRLVFDLNDFDETLRGPFEWDVKRLAASLSVAGRDRGFSDAERHAITAGTVREYREAMRTFAGMRDLEVWYSRFDVEGFVERWRDELGAKAVKALERGMAKAHAKDSRLALERLSEVVDGRRRIVSDPPLIVPVEDFGVDDAQLERMLDRVLTAYRRTLGGDLRVLIGRYRYAHAAHKVVGVGSVGNRAWVVLLLGRDDDDPLFLQAKEAVRSVLEPYSGKCPYDNQGRRVVEGQRVMQAAGDLFLGWLRTEGIDGEPRDFYVRQLWDGKRSVEVEGMGPRQLGQYGRVCGWTLARAHARSGDRVAIASYLGGGTSFDEAIADFAELYADQNERDYGELQEEVKAGRLAVA